MSPNDPTIPVVDYRGLKCPLPVLKARKLLDSMAPGEEVWIETTDPLAVVDIPHFCNEAGHSLVEAVEDGEIARFRLKRAGD